MLCTQKIRKRIFELFALVPMFVNNLKSIPNMWQIKNPFRSRFSTNNENRRAPDGKRKKINPDKFFNTFQFYLQFRFSNKKMFSQADGKKLQIFQFHLSDFSIFKLFSSLSEVQHLHQHHYLFCSHFHFLSFNFCRALKVRRRKNKFPAQKRRRRRKTFLNLNFQHFARFSFSFCETTQFLPFV